MRFSLSSLQRTVIIILRVIIPHRHIPGSVQSVYVEAVILLHQELVMVLFAYGLLKVKPKTFDHCMTFHW